MISQFKRSSILFFALLSANTGWCDGVPPSHRLELIARHYRVVQSTVIPVSLKSLVITNFASAIPRPQYTLFEVYGADIGPTTYRCNQPRYQSSDSVEIFDCENGDYKLTLMKKDAQLTFRAGNESNDQTKMITSNAGLILVLQKSTTGQQVAYALGYF
jgi:hypothetical protein